IMQMLKLCLNINGVEKNNFKVIWWITGKISFMILIIWQPDWKKIQTHRGKSKRLYDIER
ncbi:hypothetical protein EX84_15470, partial [Staphylococcus aureus]|uniref:hypothetical protein n=1 Tax=Staphylococcus aureus TaxID=1280 RepID=UPI00065B6AF7